MKDIRVLRRHPKGGRQREVGEVYAAPDKFADLMVILGKAEYADFLVHDDPGLQAPVTQEPQPEEPKVSKTVAQEAEDLGIDLEQVKGTGKDGRILRRDLREYNTRMMRAG